MTTEETTTGNQYQHAGCVEAMAPQPMPAPPDKIYRITICQMDHGYMVEAGCKTFAIESAERLAGLLSAYLLKPSETLEKYFKGNLL